MKYIKSFIKLFFYYFGLLSVYHIFKNKNVLTVVVFHRVLSEDDYRWCQSDKEWTVTDDFFNETLVFFKKHYNIVSLENVISHKKNNYILPSRPLMITFDDGWKDNYEYAYPIIRRHNVPITIFCTTDSINNMSLNWREVLSSLLLLNTHHAIHIVNILSKFEIICSTGLSSHEYIALISFSSFKSKITAEIDKLSDLLGKEKQMLNNYEIIDMYKSGLVSFGAHGHTHEPMHLLANYKNELSTSRELLSNILNVEINTMAYPHSSVTQEIHESATEIGYAYQFGGRNTLNILNSFNDFNFFSRAGIDQLELSKKNGELSQELLSLALFRLKHNQSKFDIK